MIQIRIVKRVRPSANSFANGMVSLASSLISRFRQEADQDGEQDDRHDPAHEEDRLPAVIFHQDGGHKAAKAGAQREAAEHDRDIEGAAVRRAELGRQRCRIRHGAAKSKTGQEPENDHLGDVRGQDRSDRQNAKGRDRVDDHATPAIIVGQGRNEESAQHQPEKSRRQRRPQCARRHAPIRGDPGDDRSHELGVVAFGEHGRGTEAKNQPALPDCRTRFRGTAGDRAGVRRHCLRHTLFSSRLRLSRF